MEFWLIVQHRDGERRYRLDADGTLVGQAADCPVRLAEPSVSRRHAAIRFDRDGLLIEDLGSTNGTRVNGVPVRGAMPLPVGALIEFGELPARLERRGTTDLPIRLDLPSRPDHPESASTVPGAGLSSFVLSDLRSVLAAVREGGSAGDVARQACALLESRFAGLMPRVSCRKAPGGDEALIAGHADGAMDDGRCWVEALSFRFSWLRAEAPMEMPVLAALLLDAIRLAPHDEPPDAIVGRDIVAPSPPQPRSLDARMSTIYQQAGRVALARDIGVLIEGESGTGKELLARYLHEASACPGPLIALNCAALPRDLLEAELFGVERGAATGVEARAGKFEQAHGGTLFLDELGELAPDVQAKLLRVLQERKVARLGSSSMRAIDVRVVAATNRDLRREVEAGRFRLDLYHRIADWSVTLPPLRERRGDLLPLAAHFLERECRKRGLSITGLSKDALAAMQRYDWPGNVRELEREMMRAALFMENGQVLDAAMLSERVRDPAPPAGGRESSLARDDIEAAVREAGGNMSQAADRLGVARSTLYRRMKTLGMPSP